MSVKVYCFDWAVYAERIMPAFARWLIDGDESSVYNLFAKTRCAQEEQFLPDPMKRLRIWPRAKAFVDAIPRGPHSRKEYAKLCSTEQFTALSDRYLHHYTPHLYQNSTALRSLWGAILEEYCLPQFPTTTTGNEDEIAGMAYETAVDAEAIRGELVSLLHSAGLPELAREVGEQIGIERFDWEPAEDDELTDIAEKGKTAMHGTEVASTEADDDNDYDLYADEDEDVARPNGVLIGRHPNTLHLRGWLAGYSVRSMALFEYLALGRRRMPFGYEPGEPLGCYSGYLMPTEVWQLATSLRDAQPPSQSEAEDDYKRFVQQQQQTEIQETFRLPDEVQPAYAHDFLKVVRRAALYNLGLICSVE